MAVVSPRDRKVPPLYDAELEAPDRWVAVQDRLAAQAVRIAWEGSAEARARLERSGIEPAGVSGLADLASVEVLTKDALPELQAADPPFGGMLAVPVGSLRRVFQSPGPILDPEGDEADFWRVAPAAWAAGLRQGQVVLNTFSYHLTPGGYMLDAGLRRIGCVVIPGGVASSDAQIALATAAGATGYTGTPQFLLTLAEKARDGGVPLGLERALVTGAPLPDSLRARLQDEFGIDVHQMYGTADAGTLGYECVAKEGWHVAPGVAIEVLEPGSGRRAPVGQAGEVVVTSPNPTYPLVRFGTGDLSAFDERPCSCGRTSPRLRGFLGRVGEGVKVRGMFVHPRQLAAVLASDPAVARYQAVVTAAGHQDVLTVRVEAEEGTTLEVASLERRLRTAVALRLRVQEVGRGELEEGAPPLVDQRQH